MEVKDYMELLYPIIIETINDDEEIYYKASIKELPGLVVYVDSFEEIESEMESAKEIWLETNLELGRKINLPKESTLEAYSGKLTLRVAKSTHKVLVENASIEGISLNSYINLLIEKGLSQTVLSNVLETATQIIETSIGKFNKNISSFFDRNKSNEYHFHLSREEFPTDLYTSNTIFFQKTNPRYKEMTR